MNIAEEIMYDVKNVLSEKPLTTSEIYALTGYDSRTVRLAIRTLRLHGMKICSGNQGFWIWNGKDDSWEHTLKRIASEAKRMLELYSVMSAQPLDGQMEMFPGTLDALDDLCEVRKSV